MRVLGLFLVIMAHCGVSGFLFELRNFDVTMLIFVSAFVFAIGYRGDWKDYFFRRLRRILFPVWIFLAVYFASNVASGQSFDINTIIRSFLMVDGIGYVWIFRVMITLALINPLLYKLTNNMNGYVMLFIVVGLMLGNHFLEYLVSGLEGSASSIIIFFVSYTVSYGTISMVGMKWRKLSKAEKLIYFIVFVAIFVGFGYLRNWPSLQAYKYPPKEYYSCYGLIWSIVIYEFLTLIKIKGNAIINWIGSHTLYIYLGHIVMLRVLHIGPWYVLYGCVLAGSIILAYLYSLLKGAVRR